MCDVGGGEACEVMRGEWEGQTCERERWIVWNKGGGAAQMKTEKYDRERSRDVIWRLDNLMKAQHEKGLWRHRLIITKVLAQPSYIKLNGDENCQTLAITVWTEGGFTKEHETIKFQKKKVIPKVQGDWLVKVCGGGTRLTFHMCKYCVHDNMKLHQQRGTMVSHKITASWPQNVFTTSLAVSNWTRDF